MLEVRVGWCLLCVVASFVVESVSGRSALV